MGRLIDADELKEIIGCGNAVKYGNEDREQQDVSYSTMMMYEINDAIDAAPTACEWISMEDREPADGETVIVYIQDLRCHELDPLLAVAWVRGDRLDYDSMDMEHMMHNKCTVTHWMPLPKPPERSSQ